MGIENLIFSQLVYNESYVRRVIPYLKEEYFHSEPDKLIFIIANEYIQKYNRSPTPETLRIDLDSKRLDEKVWEGACKIISSLEANDKIELKWLVDQTETFCRDKAIDNALRLSMNIVSGKEKKYEKGSVPQILTEALAVSFDTEIGHDYLDNWEDRYEFYHKVEEKLPFDIDIFNEITHGGITPKTLTVFAAGPHVGKTLMKCHLAASNLYMGKNVLFITNEMSEENIAKRIDCNLLDISINDIDNLSKEMYERKIERVRGHTRGKLIIKEYPTTYASAATFRYLLNELKIKKNFVPDVIYVDYLNNMASSRIKRSGASLYEYVKSIGEELRGLGGEFNVPIITSTQINRSGFKSSDVGMGDVAESFGTPMTADAMFSLSVTEELIQMGKIEVTQLKNRFRDMNYKKKFFIGVDRFHFRLMDSDMPANNIEVSSKEFEYPKLDIDKYATLN